MSTNLVVTVPAKDSANQTIETAGYPTIALHDFRMVQRLDGTVNDDRALSALRTAVLRVVEELQRWQIRQTPNQNKPIAPSDSTFLGVMQTRLNLQPWFLGGVMDDYEHLFRTAVYAYAAATLHEQMRGFDTTNDHRKTSDEAFVDYVADDLRASGFVAIRRITGEPSADCELL